MQTKELVTKSGKKYSIKSYLTFDEVEPVLGAVEDKFKQSAKLIELALVSLEDSTENVYARARQLPVYDYNEIATAVTSAVTGNFPQGN
jgi:hypothetical protein